jgi:hypothetical protein
MNNAALSSIIWAMLLSLLLSSLLMFTPPAFSAIYNHATPADAAAEVNEQTTGSNETQVVKIQTEKFLSDDGGVWIAQAPTPPAPPLPPLPPLSPHSPMADIDKIVSSALSEAFGTASTHASNRTIKNAPYSAEVISERVQTLADGNQIVKRTSQMSFRDSVGRTRTESRDANGTPRSINIFDAADGTRYVLKPETKSAIKSVVDPDFMKRIEELRERAKSTAKDAKTTILRGGTPGEQVIVHRVENTTDGAKGGASENINVQVFRSDGTEPLEVTSGTSHMITTGKRASISIGHANGSADAIMASSLGTTFQDRAWSSKATTKELGFKDIEGVRAEGKLRAYTIPAGEIGNKNAITVSTETWTSPELQITVYSKHSDPRTGEVIYRLTNVNRSEQPRALFSVPDGYTIKSMSMPSISIKSK